MIARRHRRASAAIEFAIALPVLLIVMTGVIDITTLLRGALKAERMAGEVGNVTAQAEALSEASVASLLGSALEIAKPWPKPGEKFAFILTGISNTGNGAIITWQRRTGNQDFRSSVGATGTAKLPTGFSLPSGQSAIVAESFLTYTPLLLGAVANGFGSDARIMNGFAIYRPRTASLTSISQ